MKALILILIGVIIALEIADLVILCKYCTAGVGGYDDKWSSERAKIAHYIIAPMPLTLSLMLTIFTSIFAIIM